MAPNQKKTVAAAFIVLDKKGNITHSAQYQLPSHSNNSIVETVAIAKAIVYVKGQNKEKHYQVLTDSLV